MTRRIVGFTAVIIGALTLMLIPASGMAESLQSCEGCVNKVPLQNVEVTYLTNPPQDNMVVVPILPRKHRSDTRFEHEYFRTLYGIAAGMCESVENTYVNHHIRSYTGFNPQLMEFDTVRKLLNKLLRRDGLGYAPSLEDFSEAWGLEFPLPPTHGSGLEGGSAGLASACMFRVV